MYAIFSKLRSVLIMSLAESRLSGALDVNFPRASPLPPIGLSSCGDADGVTSRRWAMSSRVGPHCWPSSGGVLLTPLSPLASPAVHIRLHISPATPLKLRRGSSLHF